ncbi:glycosyltransferase [Cytobacillus firmus]|uniref:glycosyltransferase family 2 protein n=1 Tax=Cytobacillus firmus TaxID=1399 RepID=UPI00384CC969
MERQKKISIVVPVYNVESFLSECIESLIKQTYKNLEILLIDDGSTDKSSAICDEYASLDKRIKVFHQKNAGVSSARNFGLGIASGDYIGFIDSDDWINPRMYEVMLSRIEEESAEMCVFTKYIRGETQLYNSSIKSLSLDKKDAIMSILNYNFPTSLWTSLYKRSCLEGLFLNEEIHHLEDFEFQFRVLFRISKVAVCHDAFYNYRLREGSANTSGFNEKVISCLKVLPTVKEYIRKSNFINQRYIAATKSRLTLTLSAFLAKSKYGDPTFEKIVTKNARDAWYDTIRTGVPYKKKILIVLLAISYNFYAKLYKVIKL